ncbi:hypothetical protein EGW08_002942, partial [Elysia chlorotica]
PEVRDGHLGHSLGVHNEDEAWALGNHFLYGQTSGVTHKAQHREDDKASKHRGEAVNARDYHSNFPLLVHTGFSPEDVVAELVIAGQCDEGSPRHTHREENLGSSVAPHLEGGEFVPLRNQVPFDAMHSTRQSQASDKQDGQHQIWEGGCHI